MPLRRIWTQYQDKTLKYLREDLNIQRWSLIAQKLQNDFGIVGRNQKQCRQRYHNHLDSSVKMGKLTQDEEKLLFNLHNKLGNKWAQIATYFSGRTDSSLKNIFHSKLRKGIRKFNRVAKEKFNSHAKTYPLNFFSKILDKYQFKLDEQSDGNQLDYDFLKHLQNKLIQYAGSFTRRHTFGRMSEDEVFQHLNDMLSKIQQYQKPDKQIENDSGSESSEYFPVKKRKNSENNNYFAIIEQDENFQQTLILRKSSLKSGDKMEESILMERSKHQQEMSLVRKNSFQTQTALSQHFQEKLQVQPQELSLHSFNQNKGFEFQIMCFDAVSSEKELDKSQKNDETEIYYRQILESQCSPSEELFNLIVNDDFNVQTLF